jgi:hypothetical protein
MEAPAKEESNY